MSAAARREQLLDVTTRVVDERGFHALSIETVAREAGVTRPLIYQHYPDLNSLLEAVIEREMSRAHSQLSRTSLADLSQGDPLESMLESLSAFLDAVRDHPATWRLVLMPAQGAPESLCKRIAQGRAHVLSGLAGAVRPVLEAESDSGDAEVTASVLSAISDEYARLVLTDPARFPPERLVGHARRFLRQQWLVP